LKITLWFPAGPGGGSTPGGSKDAKSPMTPQVETGPAPGMKKVFNSILFLLHYFSYSFFLLLFSQVFQTSKDYTTLTLNPKWNASFSMTLPFSKTVLRAAIERHQINTDNLYSSSLSDHDYDVVVKAMLQHWSSGIVEIEVFDGERFNEEIFMGKVNLLMTSFHLFIKKFDDLEMKGNFQLDKYKATQRVSGSIYLHAFLHVPEKKYVEEQISQLLTAIQLQEQQKRVLGPKSRSSYGYLVQPPSDDEAGNESSSSEIHNQQRGGGRSASRQNDPFNNRRITQLQNDAKRSSSVGGRGSISRVMSDDDLPLSGSKPLSAQRQMKKGDPNSISSYLKHIASEQIASQDDGEMIFSRSDDSNPGSPPYRQANHDLPPPHPHSHQKSHNNNSNHKAAHHHRNYSWGGSSEGHYDSEAVSPPQVTPVRTAITPKEENSRHSTEGFSSSTGLRRPLTLLSGAETDPFQSPVHSLNEVRENHISVTSIVTEDVALESTLHKKNFLKNMKRQLHGLQALTHSAEVSVNTLTKKLVEGMSSPLPPALVQKITTPYADSHRQTESSSASAAARSTTMERKESSNFRQPTPVSASTSTSANPKGNVSRGISSLMSHVNQAVQNLEHLLVSPGELLEPENDEEKESFAESDKKFREQQLKKRSSSSTSNNGWNASNPSNAIKSGPGYQSYSIDLNDDDDHGYELNDDDYHDSGDDSFDLKDGDNDHLDEEEGGELKTQNESGYFEKRLSVRDLQNQHVYKFHHPDSPTSTRKHADDKSFFRSKSDDGSIATRFSHQLPPESIKDRPLPSAPTSKDNTPRKNNNNNNRVSSPPSPPPGAVHSANKKKSHSRSISRDDDLSVNSKSSGNRKEVQRKNFSREISSSSPSSRASDNSEREKNRVFENKSLSREDIEELSERVKHLSNRMSLSGELNLDLALSTPSRSGPGTMNRSSANTSAMNSPSPVTRPPGITKTNSRDRLDRVSSHENTPTKKKTSAPNTPNDGLPPTSPAYRARAQSPSSASKRDQNNNTSNSTKSRIQDSPSKISRLRPLDSSLLGSPNGKPFSFLSPKSNSSGGNTPKGPTNIPKFHQNSRQKNNNGGSIRQPPPPPPLSSESPNAGTSIRSPGKKVNLGAEEIPR
jgi:hypothetical protein